MKRRLIWGDIAEEHLLKLAEYYRDFHLGDVFARAAEEICDMPTVDAVEVVYGQWERTDKYYEDSNVRCSRCKMEFDYIDGMCYLVEGVELPSYCPNCGADMRGDFND